MSQYTCRIQDGEWTGDMDRSQRVGKDRREIEFSSFERWKGFQPSPAALRGPKPNFDGSVPSPSVAAVIASSSTFTRTRTGLSATDVTAPPLQQDLDRGFNSPGCTSLDAYTVLLSVNENGNGGLVWRGPRT